MKIVQFPIQFIAAPFGSHSIHHHRSVQFSFNCVFIQTSTAAPNISHLDSMAAVVLFMSPIFLCICEHSNLTDDDKINKLKIGFFAASVRLCDFVGFNGALWVNECVSFVTLVTSYYIYSNDKLRLHDQHKLYMWMWPTQKLRRIGNWITQSVW